jgi:hypothetical protein
MVISTSKHLKKQEKAQMIQRIESFSDHYAMLFEKGAAQEEYESVSRNYVLQKIAEYYAQ